MLLTPFVAGAAPQSVRHVLAGEFSPVDACKSNWRRGSVAMTAHITTGEYSAAHIIYSLDERAPVPWSCSSLGPRSFMEDGKNHGSNSSSHIHARDGHVKEFWAV